MKRACPHCGRIMDGNGCPAHPKPTGPYGTRNPRRDLVAHNRWARAIKRRDGYRCQSCGATENLHAHHIDGLSSGQGVTLCHACHRAVDRYAT